METIEVKGFNKKIYLWHGEFEFSLMFIYPQLIEMTRIGPFSVAMTNGAGYIIYIPENWAEGDQEMYDFTLFHEIGHIVNGHLDKFENKLIKKGIIISLEDEIEADKYAFDHLGFKKKISDIIKNFIVLKVKENLDKKGKKSIVPLRACALLASVISFLDPISRKRQKTLDSYKM